MTLSQSITKAIQYYNNNGLSYLLTESGKFCTRQAAKRVAPRARFVATLYNHLRVYDRADLRVYSDCVYPYGNAEAIDIKASPCSTAIPTEISHIFGPHHFEQPFVAEFQDGYIHTTGVTLDSNGTVLLDALGSRRDVFEQKFFQHPLELLQLVNEQHRGIPDSDRELDTVCPLISSPQFELKGRGGGFAGFIRTTLPVLQALEHYKEQTGRSPYVLVPADYRDKQIEALVFMGLDPDRIIRWHPGERIRARHLVVPSTRRCEQLKSYRTWTLTRRLDRWYNSVAPSAYHWTRERGRNRLADIVCPNEYSNKIYISRADATERQIINEGELLAHLETHGFESYKLAELSLVDQMALFSQADIVVGPHGAGLANITFCSDCTVIEIAGVKNRPTFLMQAKKLDLDYRLIVGKNNHLNNIIVKPEKFNKYL